MHVSGLVANGDKLSITLERPAGDFLTRLSQPCFCPVPSHARANSGRHSDRGADCIGRAVLHRSDEPAADGPAAQSQLPGRPRPRRAARIVYAVGVPTTQAMADAQSGAIAVLPALDDDFSPAQADQPARQVYGPRSAAAKAGRQRFYETPSLFMDGIVLNTARPLFRSQRLRQAVNEALDRPTLARLYYDAPADQMIPPAVPGYPAGRFYPLDGPNLRRARRLVGASPRTAVLYYCTGGAFGDPRQRAVAQLVRTDLARVGIAVDRSSPPTAIRPSATTRPQSAPICCSPNGEQTSLTPSSICSRRSRPAPTVPLWGPGL